MIRSRTTPHAPPLPGPRPWPILAEKADLLAFTRNPVTFLHRLHRRYGDLAAIGENDHQYVFVFSPALNRQVLGDPEKFQVVDLPFAVPPDSALARLFMIPGQVNGPQSRRLRQVIYTALHSRFHGRYQQALTAYTTRFLNRWQAGTQIDLFPEMVQLATATPCAALFDIDPEADGRDLVRRLHQWGDDLLATSTRLLPHAWPGFSYRRLLQVSAQLEQRYQALIERKRAAGLGDDPLSTLIRQHDEGHLDEAELMGLVNNLFNAGNTSRATNLTWALFLLAQHPAILHRAAVELTAVCAGQAPDLHTLPQLHHLRHTLSETLRLLPPMNWFPRRTAVSVTFGGYSVAAGTLVMVSPFTSHRLHDVFPDPHRFEPSRWQDLQPDPFTYIPFGAGPRMCPGKELAITEMMTVLALILQRFRLVLLPGTAVNRAGMMLSAPQTMPVVVQPPTYPVHRVGLRGNISQIIQFNGGEDDEIRQ